MLVTKQRFVTVFAPIVDSEIWEQYSYGVRRIRQERCAGEFATRQEAIACAAALLLARGVFGVRIEERSTLESYQEDVPDQQND
jgi:hypothetical protein